jgi:hypothetical protein
MDKGYQAALVGAAGMILCNDKASGNEIIADPHVLPAAQITYTDGLAVFAYINSTEYALPPLLFFFSLLTSHIIFVNSYVLRKLTAML